MKTYVLTVSKTFPVKHKKAGSPTFFKNQITTALMNFTPCHGLRIKIHTIRANYNLWKKRIDEVNEGKAILSLREWSGKPYNSPQEEFMQLKKGEVGYQKAVFDDYLYTILIDGERKLFTSIPEHDGLSHDDFEEWFKGYDFREPMIIIHFTKFRY